MKVTLDIDPSKLGGEVSEFMKSLSADDKQAIVKEAVKQYYSDYKAFEQGEVEQAKFEAIQHVRKADGYYQNKPDSEIINSYKYNDFIKGYRTYAAKTREEISALLVLELTKKINEFTANDPEYKAMLAESMNKVKEAFPAMVQAAMIRHMTGQMSDLQVQLQKMNESLSNAHYDILNLKNKP